MQNLYYKKKKELADIVAVKPQQEHDEDVERLEGEIRSLRENRGNMYYDLGNMVKTMICSNPLYQRLVEKYYDFCAYTDNVIEMHKLQITLVKNKKYLDDFFDSVKRELERNTAVPEGKLKHYNFLYKDIIKLLGEVFEDMESQNSTGKEEGSATNSAMSWISLIPTTCYPLSASFTATSSIPCITISMTCISIIKNAGITLNDSMPELLNF